jgi:hypothetical protein
MAQRTLSRIKLTAAAAALACCAVTVPAHAWGLKTHLWIAEKIIDDVRLDCAMELGLGGAQQYLLTDEVCQAIRKHPAEFRAGVLGPDVFPDFVVGQVTTHPGTNAEPHAHADGSKWATGQYISHLLERASSPAEIAFAYGYMVHAAGDVFAHTYVNNYAGDVFELTDKERRVELRHFVLEKYIEARTALPAGLILDSGSVRVPTAFVTSELIFSRPLRDQYDKTPMASHVRLMRDLREKDSQRDDRTMVAKAGAVLQAGRDQLAKLRKNLDARQSELRRVERGNALSALSLTAAIGRLRALQGPDALALLRELPANAKADIVAATPQAVAVNAELTQVEQRLQSVDNAADDVETDKRAEAELDAALAALSSMNAAPAPGSQALENGLKKLLEADALLRAAASIGLGGAAGALPAARAELKASKQLYASNLKQTVADLVLEERQADALVQKASVTEAIQKLRQAIRGNRIKGMELATAAYTDASMAVALAMMNKQAKPLSAYGDWRNCWSMAYAGVPYQWIQASCRVGEELEDVRADINKNIEAMIQRLPAPLPKLARDYKQVKARLIALAQKEAWQAADIGWSRSPKNDATVKFVEMMTSPTHSTVDLVDAYMRKGEDGKDLLLLDDIDKLVDQDLPTRDGTSRPDEFQALRHSVTLAKLSLLNLDTVNAMVNDHVGTARSVFPDGQPLYPRGTGRTSILPLMVKSIDGNHQWQAYGIPYPRSSRQDNAEKRRYGYNAYTEQGYGMRMFADPQARDKLFARLFPSPFVGAINTRLQDTALNPFVTCAAVPFPVTTLADGKPALADSRCPEPGG